MAPICAVVNPSPSATHTGARTGLKAAGPSGLVTGDLAVKEILIDAREPAYRQREATSRLLIHIGK